MSTVLQQYNAAIKRGVIQDDHAQRQLLVVLQALIDALAYKWYHRWYKPCRQGLYIVGPVGGGKTYLLDLFYQCLPEKHKKRIHFSLFMQEIDQQLRFLQGQPNPMRVIAKDFAKHYLVLCLDEFIVTDITQAMILSKLLPELQRHKIVLVATSNTHVDDLYRNGANRERFLPTIALLHQYCQEISMIAARDYRLGRLPQLSSYLYPVSRPNQQLFAQQFSRLSGSGVKTGEISLQNRQVALVKVAGRVIWFKFQVICAMPRCQLDYIELASRFDTLFIEGLPALHESATAALLFIQLVDVCYDRKKRLVLLAAVGLEDLYLRGPYLQEFQRTRSRLAEMQSVDYWAQS